MEKLYALFLASSGVCTDTRKIEPNCLFIALKGENFNGNSFAEESLKLGAKCAVVDEKEYQTNANIILVDDTLKFLQELAVFHRRKFSIPVIGITGSNGKTSTKELIASVIQTKYNTLFTLGNLNNHIGVPLTVLKMKKEHEIAIIEMGANKHKDIEELAAIAEPTHGIITNIGKAHLEGFGSVEGVIKTKKELYESVESRKGTLVYNSDDEILVSVLPSSTTNYTYSQKDESAFVKGELRELNPFVNLSWKTKDYQSPRISTKMVGEYNFYNFLAAISFGVLFDVPYENINQALSDYTPSNNRSQVQKTGRNTLIVDCYNANPTSMSSALKSFKMMEAPSKFAILGDMRELGEEEIIEHQKIIDLLEDFELQAILVGPIFNQMESDFLSFPSYEELNEYLSAETPSHSMILLKDSRGIQLEKAIDLL
jgi:UDP-N-acetylmuramoyl-tripeptide--D-alanyl-D-alanine ligase